MDHVTKDFVIVGLVIAGFVTMALQFEALDETSIEISKTKKNLNAFHRFWFKPIFHRFNLFIFYF